MSQYFPPYNNSSENIKVELDLSNYATKDDVKNITHVYVSSYATKTDLAALKTEIDKIDIDKLKTVPDDLVKLSNVVKNEVVKKTDFSAYDYVKKTKYSGDINSLDDKIDKVEKKIPYVSSLETKRNITTLIKNLNDRIDNMKIKEYAKKTSLSGYMLTSTFNTKSTELENKIKDADIIAKSAVTKANSIKSNLNDYAKKTDVANDITTIKNDYVSNESLTRRLNDLKSQHITNEVKKIDDKTKKNASDILGLESRLKQKEDTINENERGLSFNRGFFYYLQKNNLVYECKSSSFNTTTINEISTWKSTGVFSSNMIAVKNASRGLPKLKVVDDYYVHLSGNHFQQNKPDMSNNIAINIYCVYKLDPISSSRDDTFTVQNALFGAMQFIKNADTSKYKYTGYGICFDEGGSFSKGNISNGKNVLIFGVDESSLVHQNNKANNIYVMGDLFVQGINDTTLYAEKIYSQNFTQPNKKFVLNLHYNHDNDSDLFVNGKQQLKFKAKTGQLLMKKLCIGNLSDDWTTSESEKTALYGNIYDFMADYKKVTDVKAIYDITP